MRIAAFVVAIVAATAPVAGAAPQDVANQVSAEIMSPFCPGVTLHDCPSDSAVALRDRITEMAQRGMSRGEIMAELEREYGPTISAVPDRSGSGLLAWLLPAVALGVGALTAWTLSRRWARAPADHPSDAGAVTPQERRRIDHELAKLRGEA